MSKALQPGDHVTWRSSQGETTGVVTKKVTGTETVKSHVAHATPARPQYRVKSDKTGAEAIHKPESLAKP